MSNQTIYDAHRAVSQLWLGRETATMIDKGPACFALGRAAVMERTNGWTSGLRVKVVHTAQPAWAA